METNLSENQKAYLDTIKLHLDLIYDQAVASVAKGGISDIYVEKIGNGEFSYTINIRNNPNKTIQK